MRMVVVNHKGVRMPHAITDFSSVQGVCVSGGQVRLVVLDHVRVMRWPDPRSQACGQGTRAT